MQLGSRSPALLATSAMSLQDLSGGRSRLGVGVSGPQVREGWEGVELRRPVQTTRETIDIVRLVSSGERLEYDGEIYQLPRPGGSGRALRVAAPPVQRLRRGRATPCRRYAFTIGAMGSARQNFYTLEFGRLGYATEVERVQQLWLAGEREAAALRAVDAYATAEGPPDAQLATMRTVLEIVAAASA